VQGEKTKPLVKVEEVIFFLRGAEEEKTEGCPER
jgi:hypothetical protein